MSTEDRPPDGEEVSAQEAETICTSADAQSTAAGAGGTEDEEVVAAASMAEEEVAKGGGSNRVRPVRTKKPNKRYTDLMSEFESSKRRASGEKSAPNRSTLGGRPWLAGPGTFAEMAARSAQFARKSAAAGIVQAAGMTRLTYRAPPPPPPPPQQPLTTALNQSTDARKPLFGVKSLQSAVPTTQYRHSSAMNVISTYPNVGRQYAQVPGVRQLQVTRAAIVGDDGRTFEVRMKPTPSITVCNMGQNAKQPHALADDSAVQFSSPPAEFSTSPTGSLPFGFSPTSVSSTIRFGEPASMFTSTGVMSIADLPEDLVD